MINPYTSFSFTKASFKVSITNLLSNLDRSLCFIAKDSLVTIFKSIEMSYSNSIERKHKYHIKVYKRSILTIFGEITFIELFILISAIMDLTVI